MENAILKAKIENISISSKNNIHSLIRSEQVNDNVRNQTQLRMSEELKIINEEILPIYTLNHAIHSLETQGFEFQKQRRIEGGRRMIFEKIVGSGVDENILCYNIDIFPGEHRLVIDAGNMPDNSCRKYIKSFEESMGTFQGFIPHTDRQQIERIKHKQKIQMR